MYRVGIVGAGAIGARRARVAADHAPTTVVAVADLDAARAQELAATCGARSTATTPRAASSTWTNGRHWSPP